jgi:hypothetical protein
MAERPSAVQAYDGAVRRRVFVQVPARLSANRLESSNSTAEILCIIFCPAAFNDASFVG